MYPIRVRARRLLISTAERALPWRSRDLGGVPKLVCVHGSCGNSFQRRLLIKKGSGSERVCIRGYAGNTFQRLSLLRTQFEDIKKQYPGYILLFQVGDFYEIYGDDASDVSSRVSLRLTRKGQQLMAGFPVRALDWWLRQLIEAGFQLAICDQIPPGKYDGRLRLMGREVVKLVTPGTLIEPLDKQANYLLSIAPGPSTTLGLAWSDISTSDFQVCTSEAKSLDEDLERICPSEVLLPEGIAEIVKETVSAHHLQRHHNQPAIADLVRSSLLRDYHLTPVRAAWYREGDREAEQEDEASEQLFRSLQRKDFSSLELSAACALLQFVLHTQRSKVPYLAPPTRYSHQSHMTIDANTRQALELVSPLHSNTKRATLLGCIDETITAAGGRLLRSRLSSPLTDVETINKRLAAVEMFTANQFHAETVAALLKTCTDLERAVQKVATRSANVTDLQAIKNTLATAGQILDYVTDSVPVADQKALADDLAGLNDFPVLVEELDKAIDGSKYGDFIVAGYSREVDSLRERMKENERKVDDLVDTLKREFDLTRVLVVPHKTYVRILEVTKTQTAKANRCKNLTAIDHTQSKTRYSHFQLQKLNAEFQELEGLYSEAQEQLFRELCSKVMGEAEGICQSAQSLARLDVSTSLGILAANRAYCKPVVVSEPAFDVRGGFHPVIASLQLEQFVRNNCNMDQHRLWIITGPNMGGKSTFLRQNCLIAILAQIGSFVPAEQATIGVVDKLFARVGASDNVVKHMSTFHMEMSETAHILRSATSHSYVVLDEIGRGTSTSEGVSIAQAVTEHLHNKLGCRTLLATHFHQLAALGQELPQSGCYKLMARRERGSITFTYRVQPGHVDHSFGVDVARLAGLPDEVTARAQALLAALEGDSVTSCQKGPTPATGATAAPLSHTKCLTRLKKLALEHTTPVEAIRILAELKEELEP